MPVTSLEVRWFFPGELARFAELRRWIESAQPFQREDGLPPGVIEHRGGAADVYVLIPGADDLCIRWRNGQLQIKGRVSRLGLQRFARRFYGAVDVWTTWSHCGDEVTRALGGWFESPSKSPWETAAVRKTRMLRKIRLGSHRGHVEIGGAAAADRVLNVELTDLEIGGQRYCSLALKVYPNDADMPEAFTEVAGVWLASLTDPHVVLAEHQTMGYPEFLKSRALMKVPAV